MAARRALEGLLRRAEGALRDARRMRGVREVCVSRSHRSYRNDRRDQTTCSAVDVMDVMDVTYVAHVDHGCS